MEAVCLNETYSYSGLIAVGGTTADLGRHGVVRQSCSSDLQPQGVHFLKQPDGVSSLIHHRDLQRSQTSQSRAHTTLSIKSTSTRFKFRDGRGPRTRLEVLEGYALKTEPEKKRWIWPLYLILVVRSCRWSIKSTMMQLTRCYHPIPPKKL